MRKRTTWAILLTVLVTAGCVDTSSVENEPTVNGDEEVSVGCISGCFEESPFTEEPAPKYERPPQVFTSSIRDAWVSYNMTGPGYARLDVTYDDSNEQGTIAAILPPNYTGEPYALVPVEGFGYGYEYGPGNERNQTWWWYSIDPLATYPHDTFGFEEDHGYRWFFDVNVSLEANETWVAVAGGTGNVTVNFTTNAEITSTDEGVAFDIFRHGTAKPVPGVGVNVDVYREEWTLAEASHLVVRTTNSGSERPDFNTPNGPGILYEKGRVSEGAGVGVFVGVRMELGLAELACAPAGNYSIEQKSVGSVAELRVYALVGVPCQATMV